MKNINVTIANVIAWFEESEQCMLHNHAQKMVSTVKTVGNDEAIITKINEEISK